MIVLIGFAFIAGLVTILSPCILPVLPIVLATSTTSGKKRPIGIITGFITSFSFFTLTLSSIVKFTGLPSDFLRNFAIIIVGIFGLSMVIPSFHMWLESVLSKLTSAAKNNNTTNGFMGGLLSGISLGLLWAPCVGPILATIITLAATSTITTGTVIITLAYASGTAIPLVLIMYGGRTLLLRVPWLFSHTEHIQKIFGFIMLCTAFAMFLNLDRRFQSYVLEQFPTYGVGLTTFEEHSSVQTALKSLTNKGAKKNDIGKPMNQVVDNTIGAAPEFISGGAWVNSTPLSLQELRGKVVLVDFWTYTCINCIRTLPYIKKWHETYKDKGLVIVGVHTPEFAFEQDISNVQKAVKDFGITYPVMQDNNYATWNAYDNHYWPAKYLIDKNGKIRDSHFGEGNYDETEEMIQKLLQETGAAISETPHNAMYEVRANSPESYLGASRIQYLSSPERLVTNKKILFSKPGSLQKNTFAFSGNWTIDSEYAMPEKGSTLTYRFDAKSVYLVMKQKVDGVVGKVNITVDGKPLDTTNQTIDSVNSQITINENRLYSIVTLPTPGEHILELKFLDDHTEVFAFTFG